MASEIIDLVPKRRKGGTVFVAKRRRGRLDWMMATATAGVAGLIGHFVIGLPFWSDTALVSDNATLMVTAFGIAYFLPK